MDETNIQGYIYVIEKSVYMSVGFVIIVTLWNFLFFMTERCYKFKNVEFQM